MIFFGSNWKSSYIKERKSVVRINLYNSPVRDIKKRNHEFTNSRIHSAAKGPFIMVYYLIHYFKNHFKPCFFISKIFKDILQHFKFVNWWIRFLMSRTGYQCEYCLQQYVFGVKNLKHCILECFCIKLDMFYIFCFLYFTNSNDSNSIILKHC